jgi:hypothetical protein
MRTLALTLAPLSLALALFAAGGAMAQGPNTNNSLTLASAANAPAKVIIDGAVWKCGPDACVASGGKSQSAERACRRVVSKLGQVSAFTWRGETLSAEALAACNAG